MSSQNPIIGRTLATRFLITEMIGEGGMATVYRGTQATEPTEVAIKIMHAAFALDSNFLRRFRREAKSAARLHHPCSVQIFDFGVEDGLPYIAMELLPGAELAQILHHERRLSEVRAARIMADVLGVLDAAHEQGIVHRDLKPENIMIARNPNDPSADLVKVLDFGIAKIMEPDLRRKAADPDDPDAPPPSSFGSTALTMMGTIVGTPEYMSPEQSRGVAIDARSDLYSCGVLLYHLVTGKVPFSAELPFETAMLHVTATPVKPSVHTPSIHPGLEALILSALEKSPDARPPSAKAMEAMLRALIPELTPTRHLTTPPLAIHLSPLDATLPVDRVPAFAAAPSFATTPSEPSAKSPPASASAISPPATTEPLFHSTAPSLPEVTEPRRVHNPSVARITSPPRPPLSDAAALLLGAGLAVIVLGILALLLLR